MSHWLTLRLNLHPVRRPTHHNYRVYNEFTTRKKKIYKDF